MGLFCTFSERKGIDLAQQVGMLPEITLLVGNVGHIVSARHVPPLLLHAVRLLVPQCATAPSCTQGFGLSVRICHHDEEKTSTS